MQLKPSMRPQVEEKENLKNRRKQAASWVVADRNELRACEARSGAVIGVAVAAVLLASSSRAHDGIQLLPPNGDYKIRWYQAHGELPVRDWEVEVTPLFRRSDVSIRDARVEPDESCWSLDVVAAEPAKVRVRALSGSRSSPWSVATAVPEPATAAGVAVGCAWLAAGLRRRSAPRELRAVRTHREE